MQWHQDTSLFYPDAFEVVLTITNTSSSKFLWKENGGTTKSVNPQANTLAIVKPISVLHSVSSVLDGERTILKFVVEFIEKDKETNELKSTFKSEFEKCPF